MRSKGIICLHNNARPQTANRPEEAGYERSYCISFTHLDHNIAAQCGHVNDGLLLLRQDLGVLHQLVQVLLRDSVPGQNVEQNDPHLVVVGDCLVEQDRHDVAHVVLDALTLCICAHGQVLKPNNNY